MNKSEFDKVLEFLKSNGFEVEKKYTDSDHFDFSKSVKTDDKDIQMNIYGDIRYSVREKR